MFMKIAGKKTRGTTMILDCFQDIVNFTGKHGLSEEFFKAAAFSLNMVSVLLEITPVQAALFSLVLERSGYGAAAMTDIAKDLNCGSIQLIKHLDEFEALEKKKLVRAVSDRQQYRSRNSQKLSFPSYMIPLDVIKALREGNLYEGPDYGNLSPEDFFNTADGFFDSFNDNEMTFDTLCLELNSLLSANSDLRFVKHITDMSLDDEEFFVLMLFSCALIEGGRERLGLSIFSRYLGHVKARVLRNAFKSGEHKLITLGLIERGNEDGMADTEYYSLTRKAIDVLLGDVTLKRKKKHTGKNWIRAKTIERKELFYSERIEDRVAELTMLLREENFATVKSRLEKKKMRTGFTCLFSGPPGTGKTETVYQIARDTGRDIFLVDISDIKSMWFGESERKIKALFDEYNSIVKQKGLTPILLFNEADGVLGKRQELGETRRSPAQTENAIQNIILQEMENLSNGILIATTNMTNNFDKAFERRFLYKIEFEQPDENVKTAIWQSVMPRLSKEEAQTLSRRFNFSGGQIDNIIRKEEISSVLRGEELSVDDIIVICGEEESVKKTVCIGFMA